MLKLTLFVYIMSIYFLLTVPFSFALLQLHSLQDPSHFFKEDVLKQLKRIPNFHICIWSRQTEVEDFDKDLLISLTSGGKSVSSFKLTNQGLFREECLHSVVLLRNFTTCSEIWTTGRPITALHSTYVLVDAKRESGIEELPLCKDVFGFARVMVVFLQERHVFSLSSPQFPPRRFLEAELSDLLVPSKLIFRNLNGREVNIATFNCTPYVVFYQKYESEFMDGVEGRMLKELSSLLNFKIKVMEMSKERYGTRTNVSWGEGGIMGALDSYEAEIGLCNIWCDLANIPVLDFGPFNNLVSYTFIAPRPRLIRGSWKNLTGIFQLNVWMAAVCCYCGCSFCYWLRCAIVAPQDNVDPIESLLTVFGMLTLTSWHTRSAARQLVLWWLVFVLLLTATYSSGIAARLTNPRYEPRIDTIKQLVDFNFYWYSNNMTDGLKAFVLNMADQTEREWGNRYRFLPAHMTPTYARSRKYAFLVQRLGSSMLVLGIHGLDYDHDLVDMRVVKEKTIDNIFTCFGLPKQSALSYTFQNALLQLRQMGLVDLWNRYAVEDLTPPYIRDLQQEKDVNVHVALTALSMRNLIPAFYILLAGLCLSSVLFAIEILHQRYVHRNLNNKVYPFTPFVK